MPNIFRRKDKKSNFDIEKEKANSSLNVLNNYKEDLILSKDQVTVKSLSIQFTYDSLSYKIKKLTSIAQKFVNEGDDKLAIREIEKIKILKGRLKDLKPILDSYQTNLSKINAAIEDNDKSIFEVSNLIDNISFYEMMEKDNLFIESPDKKILNKTEYQDIKNVTESLKTKMEARQEIQNMVADFQKEDEFSGYLSSTENQETDPEIEAILVKLKNNKEIS